MQLSRESVSKGLLLALYHLSLCVAHNNPNTYQMNQDGGHGHAHQGTGDSKVDIDAEHIKEHLDGVADLPENMSQEELEFHYFKLHDFDNNTMLDGLEIYKALTHLLPYDDIADTDKVHVDPAGKTPEQVVFEKKIAAEKYYTDIVDQVLQEDDIDNDGYLTYLEYVLARRREEMREQRQRQEHRTSL